MEFNPARSFYAFFLKNVTSKKLLYSRHQNGQACDLRIDVVIPSAEKDHYVLALTIESIKRFVSHPINKIYVVSPDPVKTKTLLRHYEIDHINDNEVLERGTGFYKYSYKNMDRSGWLKQQFIKLSADKFCEMENYLVVDSDTIFLRPVTFYRKSRYIMHVTKTYHRPYHELLTKILNLPRTSALSFISHYMLFNKQIVREMRDEIRSHTGLDWDEAIMKYISHNTISPFSEYETYGNYLFNRYRERMTREYSYGENMGRPRVLPTLDQLCRKQSNLISISFHTAT